jgi:AraC family transcriptional regulator, positive regulator of tynA and feaB
MWYASRKAACTPAARLLFDLVRGADQDGESAFSPADSYMQLAVYDLLGALFAPCDPSPVSRHADKLFARIRGVIRDGSADPDFGPREVAAVTGISLRYLQKLFTARGLTSSSLPISQTRGGESNGNITAAQHHPSPRDRPN